jgi:hypothetical protein
MVSCMEMSAAPFNSMCRISRVMVETRETSFSLPFSQAPSSLSPGLARGSGILVRLRKNAIGDQNDQRHLHHALKLIKLLTRVLA